MEGDNEYHDDSTHDPNAPVVVYLTDSQIALAKRLGLSNEDYAREVIKLENKDGE